MASGDGLVELAKAAKAVPQALLFSVGIWGGPYAKGFPEQYVEAAGGLCLGASAIGAALLVFAAIKVTIYPDAA